MALFTLLMPAIQKNQPGFRGCLMCDSLYVKANGEMPCWDDVGEDLVLRTLDETTLVAGHEPDLFAFDALTRIRQAFMSGGVPQPDTCWRCPVLGHGVATSVAPKVMRILHVEPSFLCGLACPQCIPPNQRRKLKQPPYNMSLEFYEALLRQLRHQGVEIIQFVHFEGRGDPMMNRHLGDMVRLTKELWRNAFTTVTTHGNYPYSSWLIDSRLDVLRLAVDGAFDDSYSRYRIGGRLSTVLDLMRSIRDDRRARGGHLRVEWKYILFDFNDSDAEIREAARLADELAVDLRFCLTHSQWRSKRVRSTDDLNQLIGRLAPRASGGMTFQMKRKATDASVGDVLAQHTEALLLSALRNYRSGNPGEARSIVVSALRFDPGLKEDELAGSDANPVSEHLDQILNEAAFPCTLSALANIQAELGQRAAAERLFARYLELADDAKDRARVEEFLVGLHLESALALLQSGATDACRLRIVQALAIDPGIDASDHADPAQSALDRVLLEARYPCTLSALANIEIALHHFVAAERLFARYLELAPHATDRAKVGETLIELIAGNQLGCALLEAGNVPTLRLCAAERAILLFDPGLPDDKLVADHDDPTHGQLASALNGSQYATTLATLAHLRFLRGDCENADLLANQARGPPRDRQVVRSAQRPRPSKTELGDEGAIAAGTRVLSLLGLRMWPTWLRRRRFDPHSEVPSVPLVPDGRNAEVSERPKRRRRDA